MGRKRLIVQADLTSEEDEAFLAWVKQKLRRRRLAEEIRLGLRAQYERSTGSAPAIPPPTPKANQLQQSPPTALEPERTPSSDKLQKLVKSF